MTIRALLLAAAALVLLPVDPGMAADAQKAGMPQFDLSRFPSQIFWLGVTFLVLYWVMSKIALPRIGEVLEARANRIGGDLDRASALKAEADQIKAAYEKALGESRAKAQEVGRSTEASLAREAADRQARLGNELAGRIRDAEGRFAGYRGVGRNITEKKRTKRRLREVAERFRSLTELSSDWYWESDPSHRFSANTLFDKPGWAPGAALGRTPWELQIEFDAGQREAL
ncbi:MAG: hypothetical protein ACO3CS_15980, partial [Alphaproteobacteria bacterium]